MLSSVGVYTNIDIVTVIFIIIVLGVSRSLEVIDNYFQMLN